MLNPNDWHTTSYSGVPFTDQDLEIVNDAVKAVLISEAKKRFPRNSKLCANAMIGAVALMLHMARKSKNVKSI